MVHDQQKSLIMCVTPLQMLIAEKIIYKFKDHKFDVLVVALADNEKYRYYYKKLEKLSCNSFYYVPRNGFLGFLEYINVLKKNGFLEKYKNCFLASIDSRHFQYVISKNKNTNIYTFDDGTANIIKNSNYYIIKEIAFWKKIIWYFIGIKFYMDDLKKISKKHYSIYKDIPNIISNVEYLSLLNIDGYKEISGQKIKIYLGQPLEEVSNFHTNDYINQVVAKIDVNYYFPHPREIICNNANYTIIETHLIFEDYLIEILNNNENLQVEIYSFISTALLNVAKLPRVKAIFMKDSVLYSKFENFYDLVENHLHIKVIEV